MPPTRACDELEGSSATNVIRFHTMAPTSPAKMTPMVRTSWSTTSLAMVDATLSPNTRNATKLNSAAQITARRGLSTRVDTTVAIELAASWKPFTKSNASATATTRTRASCTGRQRAGVRTGRWPITRASG